MIKAKTLFATAMMLSVCMLHVDAQQVDGRDFSIDGFAACTGKTGTNYYRAEGTTGGAGVRWFTPRISRSFRLTCRLKTRISLWLTMILRLV